MTVLRTCTTVLVTAAMAAALAAACEAQAAPAWQHDLLATSTDAADRPDRGDLLPPATELAFATAQDEVPAPDPAALEKPYQGPRRWWAVLSSAVVPGLGQSMTGHYKWGAVMIATDATMIVGAIDQNQKGQDLEVEYKAFADANYSEDQWARALAAGDLEPYFGHPAGSGPESVPLYVPKDVDEREWYENIGKWDQFAWGWREYWDVDWPWPKDDLYVPGQSPAYDLNNIFDTPLRAQYVAMRGESNDAFKSRDRFINVSILLRFFSVVQMAYFEGFIGGGRFANDAVGEPAANAPPQMTWFLAPHGPQETRVGVKVSY